MGGEDRSGDLAQDLQRVHALAGEVRGAGGRALIVGGYARSEALRRLGERGGTKDVDVEVYGLTFEQLRPLLVRAGDIDVVGAAFQVAKIKHTSIDVSIPRSDSKVGAGHRGFDVKGDPTMSIREATGRRDFTVNALALDPLTDELIDEHGGMDDLRTRTLRATDPALFGDDPLRVLRAMQLAGRLAMRVEPSTAELCRRLDLTELAAERIGEEWSKLLLLAERPSLGLQVGRDLGVMDRLHPELALLVGTPQEPRWHPEGDVWTHTLLVVDAAAAAIREHGDLPTGDAPGVMLAAVCHDLGKPLTTRQEDGRITSHGHSQAGLAPAASFLATLRTPGDVTAKVLKLVEHHLWPAHTPEFSDRAVRRLARDLAPASIELLVLLSTADHRGRGGTAAHFTRGRELLRRAGELEVLRRAASPIVMGRDLIALGLVPGPQYAQLLDFLYEAQEAGEFTDLAGGLDYLRSSGRLAAR